MTTTWGTFILVTLLSSGQPNIGIFDYDTLASCEQAGNRYKTYACVKVVVNKADWRK